MDANQTTPHYELKDELARLCLPSASRDVSLKLAWVNSVCLLFLLIGFAGARRGVIFIKPVPPHPDGGSGGRPARGVAAPGRRPKIGAGGTQPPAAGARCSADHAEHQFRGADRRHPGRPRRPLRRAAPAKRPRCMSSVRSTAPARAGNGPNRHIPKSPWKPASKAPWCCRSPATTRAMSFPWT